MKLENMIKIERSLAIAALVCSALSAAGAIYCFSNDFIMVGIFNAALTAFNWSNYKGVTAHANEMEEALNELRDGNKDL